MKEQRLIIARLSKKSSPVIRKFVELQGIDKYLHIFTMHRKSYARLKTNSNVKNRIAELILNPELFHMYQKDKNILFVNTNKTIVDFIYNKVFLSIVFRIFLLQR